MEFKRFYKGRIIGILTMLIASIFLFGSVLRATNSYIVIDSASEIQPAIDELEANNGGIVHVQCGTYDLSTGITIEEDNIILEGEGSCTVLRAADSSNINVIRVGGTQTKGWSIRYLKIDGNKAKNSSGNGIYVNISGTWFDSKAFIDHVDIINPKNDGYKEMDSIQMTELKLSDMYVEGADGNGYYITGSDHKGTSLTAGNCKKVGFFLTGSNDQYTNCKAYGSGYLGSGTYPNFKVTGSKVQLVNCQAQDGWASGFSINAEDVVLVGCQADSNHKNGTLTGRFAGIWVGPLADKVVITGNRCFDRNTVKQQDYGIIVEVGATDYTIDVNGLKGNKTGEILIL